MKNKKKQMKKHNQHMQKKIIKQPKEHFKYDITDFTSKDEMKKKLLKEISSKEEFKKVLEAFAQS